MKGEDKADGRVPFTGESLRALVLEKKVFGQRAILPSKEAFEQAARTLNGAVRCEALRSRPDDWGHEIRSAAAALRQLSALYGRKEFEGVALPAHPIGLACQSELRRVEQDLAIHQAAEIMLRGESAHKVRWQAILHGISAVFDKMTAPTKWGVAEGGPRARFVAAIVPSITGESATVGNIALHLKQLRKVKR